MGASSTKYWMTSWSPEEVRALHGVEAVHLEVVVVAGDRRRAALGGHRVAPHRVDLRDHGHGGPGVGLDGGDGGAQPGGTAADDHDVVSDHFDQSHTSGSCADRAGESGRRSGPPQPGAAGGTASGRASRRWPMRPSGRVRFNPFPPRSESDPGPFRGLPRGSCCVRQWTAPRPSTRLAQGMPDHVAFGPAARAARRGRGRRSRRRRWGPVPTPLAR